MFTAAVFTIVKIWKLTKYPRTDEWVKNPLHIYTMEYYSDRRRDEVMKFVVKWMGLEGIMP